MNYFLLYFKWIMLLSGVLTCTMLLGLVSPESSLKSNFGESIDGPLANIIVRNWSALIGLMGVMLIYGAFVPTVRSYSLIIVGTSKVIFIGLVLSLGKAYLGYGVGTAVIADSIMVLLYIAYLYFSGVKKSSVADKQ